MRPVLRLVPVLVALLCAAGCARQTPRAAAPAPDRTAPARAAFGDHMEKYQGQPLTALIRDFGPPSRQRPASDGGTIAVWSRKGETTVDGKTFAQDCEVTAFVDPAGTVSGIFGGGNIVYCAKEFVPPTAVRDSAGELFSGPQASPPGAALPPPGF
ncbi:hypothetical protein [Zavarzinia aquatilis]|uniref:Lipoprotein n=1 Tax=Zavarzinia aquatilis TaxID=2211142 RepID=A0A317EEG2_9PROT|nr:hypothetical protein [Zavarzinia aquatilis]PWR25141.1 hypothetical protein DKG74_05090 [Zavarzinia aquatilis]